MENISEAHLGWDGEAVADFFGAVAEGGGIGEEHEGFAASFGGTTQEIIAERIFGGMVELEPEVARCDLGDGFDAGGGDRAENEGNVMSTCGPSEYFAGFRPHQALQTDGSDAKRRGVFAAEEGGFLGSALVVAQVGGAEFNGTDVAGVFVQIDLGHAATREVVVGKAWDTLAGAFGQKFDRRVGRIHQSLIVGDGF